MVRKIFTMISFTPVGFKEINYPVQYCSLCRGQLTELCNFCLENKTNKNCCEVIQDKNNYYHTHCHKFVNAKHDGKQCHSSDSDNSSDDSSDDSSYDSSDSD